MFFQVFGKSMGHGHGGSGEEQLQRHRPANDIGRPDDNRMPGTNFDTVKTEQGHDAPRRTWTQAVLTQGQFADVKGMKTIHILITIDAVGHLRFVNVVR